MLGEKFEITLGPNARSLLHEELRTDLDSGWQVSDFPPTEWTQPGGEEPPD